LASISYKGKQKILVGDTPHNVYEIDTKQLEAALDNHSLTLEGLHKALGHGLQVIEGGAHE
jgi:hypothetical protein